MIEYNEVLIYSDQPQTCPKCGLRTEIILDISHINNKSQVLKCLNDRCDTKFVVESDKDFLSYENRRDTLDTR